MNRIATSGRKGEDLMKRNTKLALVLCLAMLGTAIEARAECQYVHGSIAETVIPTPYETFNRLLGNVTGVLNGASTVVVNTSLNPVTSHDVFVTNQGDMLTAIGTPTRTPVPGKPGRIHLTRGPDDHRRGWQVRQRNRLDDVRWTKSRWGARCGNRRFDLSRLRLRSEC